MRDFIEDNIIVIGIIVIIFMFLMCALIQIPLAAYICSKTYASFENKYDLWAGCQIRVGDKWIPASSYYFKEEAKD